MRRDSSNSVGARSGAEHTKEARYRGRTFVSGFLDLSNAFPTTWREGLFTRLFAMLGDCRSVRLARPLPDRQGQGHGTWMGSD
jgi:hypothetical protein